MIEWERDVLWYAYCTRLRAATWAKCYLSNYPAYLLSELQYRLALGAQKVAKRASAKL